LHAGHFVRGAAEVGRRSVNFPPQTLHSPSHSSYSYNGIFLRYFKINPLTTTVKELPEGLHSEGTSSPRIQKSEGRAARERGQSFYSSVSRESPSSSQLSNLKSQIQLSELPFVR
jgi:hypothetical protein